jgi:hypothetical protein
VFTAYAIVRSAEYRGGARAEEYVAWAQDALEAGHDSPALLRLAIEEPPFFTPDLRALFEAAVDELGLEKISGEQALIIHAQDVARRLAAGELHPREAATLLSNIFPPDLAPRGFTDWYLVHDCDYCRESFAGPDRTLEQAIRAEASKLRDVDWRAHTS